MRRQMMRRRAMRMRLKAQETSPHQSGPGPVARQEAGSSSNRNIPTADVAAATRQVATHFSRHILRRGTDQSLALARVEGKVRNL